jgi:hypothetical protein
VAGDVVFFRLGESALYVYALVVEDGMVPPANQRTTGTKADVETFAAKALQETGGRLRELIYRTT